MKVTIEFDVENKDEEEAIEFAMKFKQIKAAIEKFEEDEVVTQEVKDIFYQYAQDFQVSSLLF